MGVFSFKSLLKICFCYDILQPYNDPDVLVAVRDNPHSLLKVFSNDSETPCWAHMIIYIILWYPHLHSFLTTSFLFKLICYIFYKTLSSSGVGAARDASQIALILQLKFCIDICVGVYVYILICMYKCSQASVYMYMHIYIYTHTPTHPSTHTLSVLRKITWSFLQQSFQIQNDSHFMYV